MRVCKRVLVVKPDGKWLLGKPRHIYGRTILQWILNKYNGKMCTGIIWLKIGTNGEVL
jgi:hypothetical protein